MKTQTYKKIALLLKILALVLVGLAFWFSSVLIALTTIWFSMAILTLLQTRVKGVLVDERQQEVAGNAAQTAFKILLPLLALGSITLILGGGKEEFHYVKSLGIILSYITCLALGIYGLAYYYFNRKTGGN